MAENSRKNEFFERESIAIIAILAAMLMPALQKARGTAQSSKCLSNIRQIGGGIIQYGLDHKDLLLPATIAPVGTANAKYNNGLTYVNFPYFFCDFKTIIYAFSLNVIWLKRCKIAF